jgi:uncharacterized membrane protein HdeD (DUF308 family)
MEGLLLYIVAWLLLWAVYCILTAKRVGKEEWEDSGVELIAVSGLVLVVWPVMVIAAIIWVLSSKIAEKE